MLEAMKALAERSVMERLVLLVNHVIAAEPAAIERLRPHAARTLQIELNGWPSLLPARRAVRLSASRRPAWSNGSPARRRRRADLRVAVDAANPALALTRVVAGERPQVEVAGDAAFASDVDWLIDNLRWDVQDDLARFVGDAPARQIAKVGGWFAARDARGREGAARPGGAATAAAAPRWPAAAAAPMRHFARLVVICVTVLRFGLDELALSGFRQRWVRLLVRVITIGRRLDAPRGERLRLALERLGPIFVKFGQVLSTRRDLLPPDIADELAQAAGPRAAVSRRRGARRSVEKRVRPADRRASSPASTPRRWRARRSRRCTSRC